MTDKEIHDFLSQGNHTDNTDDKNISDISGNSVINSEIKSKLEMLNSENENQNKGNDSFNSSNDKVGLILAGGGGKGAYQLGVLKALKENGYLNNVSDLSGASIGAVNALLYAMDDIDLMYKVWNEIDMQTLFDVDLEMLADQRFNFSRDEMVKLLDKYIDYDKLKSSGYGIYSAISCVNGDTKTAEYRNLIDYDTENVKKILLASTALPVIYEPVVIDDKKYIDGGVTDNEPVKPLYDKGIRKFIVIGMKENKIFDTSKWPDAEIISIYPSHDIGDFVDGTIDFRDKSIEFREMLGYKDGLRAIKTKFNKEQIYINLEKTLAENDFNEIKLKLHTNSVLHTFNENISSNIDKFNEIAKKYDK